MAKKEKSDKKGKEKGLSPMLKGIIVIVLIVVLLASSIFVIFDAIVGFFTNIAKGIVEGTLDFLAHPFENIIDSIYKFDNWLSSLVDGTFDGTRFRSNSARPISYY